MPCVTVQFNELSAMEDCLRTYYIKSTIYLSVAESFVLNMFTDMPA